MPGQTHVTIRRVQPGDGRLLREVRLRALATDPGSFGSTHDQVARRNDSFWREWAAEHATGDEHCTMVALVDAEPVGLVRAEREPGRPAVFGIYSMWVAPEARRRGLGLRLLADVERWIVDAGGSEAELNVVDQAIPALRVYERAGYRLDGRREPSVHPGAVELGMHKHVHTPGDARPPV